MRSDNRQRRGVTIIVTAMLLTIAIPLVGLAVDAGLLYSTRAKIQSAADAASMAAARSLSVGLTLADQIENCKKRAKDYFEANFPEGTAGATIDSVAVDVFESTAHTRSVKVSVSVKAPAYFMRYLGWGAGPSGVKVTSIGETSRRDVNIMLVLDRSGSLQSAGACDDLESASITFVKMFANQRDRLGLVTFGGSSRVDYPASKAFKDAPALADEIDKLYPGGCRGWTGSAHGVWQGYQQIVANAEPGALNVLVFFTDGRPNTLTADWPVKSLTTPTVPSETSRCYDWGNNLKSTDVGWNPSNQFYTGWMAVATNGPRFPVADPIPVAAETDSVTTPKGFSGPSPIDPSEDCHFINFSGDGWRDVAYIPDTDVNGTSIFGWQSVSTFDPGHPYAGKAIPGDYTNGENAAINALDNAAQRIRARALDATVDVVVYTIGLGDVGDQQHELLRRVANDKLGSSFDSGAPEGKYVYAPTGDDLNTAFARIASEILRFSK
jgi:Flp pilus assembly protein TadG